MTELLNSSKTLWFEITDTSATAAEGGKRNMHESELWSSMGELNTIQKPVKQGRRSGDGPACQPDVQSFLVVFS